MCVTERERYKGTYRLSRSYLLNRGSSSVIGARCVPFLNWKKRIRGNANGFVGLIMSYSFLTIKISEFEIRDCEISRTPALKASLTVIIFGAY